MKAPVRGLIKCMFCLSYLHPTFLLEQNKEDSGRVLCTYGFRFWALGAQLTKLGTMPLGWISAGVGLPMLSPRTSLQSSAKRVLWWSWGMGSAWGCTQSCSLPLCLVTLGAPVQPSLIIRFALLSCAIWLSRPWRLLPRLPAMVGHWENWQEIRWREEGEPGPCLSSALNMILWRWPFLLWFQFLLGGSWYSSGSHVLSIFLNSGVIAPSCHSHPAICFLVHHHWCTPLPAWSPSECIGVFLIWPWQVPQLKIVC